MASVLRDASEPVACAAVWHAVIDISLHWQARTANTAACSPSAAADVGL